MCELVEQAAEERLELRKEVAELNIAIEKRRQRVLVSESGHCSTIVVLLDFICKAVYNVRFAHQPTMESKSTARGGIADNATAGA